MTGRSLARLTDVDHGGAWKQLTVERMTLQAQYDGASNLYWRLVRRRQVKRDWNKITGCESRSEEVGHGPEARLGSRICHSRDGSMCDYGAATSEGLIVRSIHRYCQFHPRWFKKRALRHCPLVNMWWASFGRTSARRSTFSRCSWPPRRCLRRRRRGVTAGCPRMRRLEMALVRMRHPSPRLGWVSIDAMRRFVWHGAMRRSVWYGVFCSTLCIDGVFGCSNREQCKCLFAIWA